MTVETPEQVAHAERLRIRGIPVEALPLPVGGRLTCAPMEALQLLRMTGGRHTVLRGAVGDAAWSLCCPGVLIEKMIERTARLLARKDMPPELQLLGLTASLEPLLDRLEDFWGADVKLTEVSHVTAEALPVAQLNFAAIYEAADKTYEIAGIIDNRLLADGFRAWHALEKDDPGTRLAYRVGWAGLDRPVSEIRVDDTIIFAQSPLLTNQLLLLAGDAFGALAVWDGSRLMSRSRLLPIAGTAMEAFAGPTSNAFPHYRKTQDVVVCDLMRRRVTTSEAVEISDRPDLDLPAGVIAPAPLFVGEEAVAIGHIVRVGMRMGFRVSEVSREHR